MGGYFQCSEMLNSFSLFPRLYESSRAWISINTVRSKSTCSFHYCIVILPKPATRMKYSGRWVDENRTKERCWDHLQIFLEEFRLWAGLAIERFEVVSEGQTKFKYEGWILKEHVVSGMYILNFKWSRRYTY